MILADQLLSIAAQACPNINNILKKYGDCPVREFLDSIEVNTSPSFQRRDDFWGLVKSEITFFFGEELACEAINELKLDPIIPTSNHYGIDTAADSIQGTLLFLLRKNKKFFNSPIVVFGFSSISMNNNFSYPMGLQFYDHKTDQTIRLPQKIPIFPNKFKRQAVCAVKPFDEKMIQNAKERLIRMKKANELTAFSFHSIENALDQIFSDHDIFGLKNYGEQACIINNELWQRSFKKKPSAGIFIQLQIEKICKLLLFKDLRNSSSLVYQLFFSTCVREHLINKLDGAKACWKQSDLKERCNGYNKLNHGGTIFFWGLTESGHRVPLTVESRQSETLLYGISDHNQIFSIKFHADHIIPALEAGIIIPSLFTCFAVLAFARGLHCVGGYYQAEYLPIIQQGIVDALNVSEIFRDVADLVRQVPTRTCLAGLQWLALKRNDNSVIPLGPIELAGAGGMDSRAFETINALSIRDAYLLGFTELLDQMVSCSKLPYNWMKELSIDNGKKHYIQYSAA